jgi:hypothetical protein
MADGSSAKSDPATRDRRGRIGSEADERARRARIGTRGASLVEYLVLIGVVALLAIVAWRQFSGSVTLTVGREAHRVQTLEGAEGDRGTGSEGLAPGSQTGSPGSGAIGGPASGDPGSGTAVASGDPGSGTGPGSGPSAAPAEPGGGALALDWPSRIAASPADPRGGSSGSWGPHGSSGSWAPTPEEIAARADAIVQGALKIMCPKDKAFLDGLRARGVTITAFDRIYFEDPYYDGTKWTTKHFEAGGTTSEKNEINIIAKSDAQNAATIYHEGVHTGQRKKMPWRDKEYEAYIKGEQWAIAHGQPPHDPDFRTTDKAGKPVVNTAAIRNFVDKEYPGVTTTSASGAPEQVVDRTPDGKTVVQRADLSTYERAPRPGDSFSGEQMTVPDGGMSIDMNKLRCP